VPPSEIPLADLKLEKWDQIKYSRNLNEFGGFEWNGNRFNSSQISTIRINGQAQAAIVAKMTESPFSVTWTLANNKSIELTANEMISISMALATHVNFCHNRSTILRAQLELAESRQQISEVNW